jgi:exonuclease VII large subunit
MDVMSLEQIVRNIDRRLDRVEQFLPTLATREELRAAVAPLAIRDEMHAAIGGAVAPLATRMDALEQKLADESERTRAQSRMLHESLKDDIRPLAEGLVSVQRTLDQTIRSILGNHEQRITALEVGRGPGPVRRRG